MDEELKIDKDALWWLRCQLTFHYFGYLDSLFTEEEKQQLAKCHIGKMHNRFRRQYRRICRDILRYDDFLCAVYRAYGLDTPAAIAEELLLCFTVQRMECAERGVPLWTNLYREEFRKKAGEEQA